MSTKNSIIIVIALAVIGLAVYQFGGLKKQPAQQAATTTTPTEATMQKQELKDGSYEATGNYTSPNGPETIEVQVTLQDGLITEAEVTPQAVNPVSVKMQNMFKDGFKEMVIGKDITEVELTKVSASSLTPQGFNDALQQIIQEAQG